jgi:hypothetical protein
MINLTARGMFREERSRADISDVNVAQTGLAH